jgi:cytochrome c oxidase assembly protein subunit 15
MLREEWVGKVGLVFLVHRSFSLVLLALHVLYFAWAYKFSPRQSALTYWNQALLLLILLEIVSGMGMAYFGVPAFLQPVHLLFGSMILGVQFILMLLLKEQSNPKLNPQL